MGKHGEKAGWVRVRKVRNMEIGNQDLGSNDAKSGTITTERRNDQQWMLGISFHLRRWDHKNAAETTQAPSCDCHLCTSHAMRAFRPTWLGPQQSVRHPGIEWKVPCRMRNRKIWHSSNRRAVESAALWSKSAFWDSASATSARLRTSPRPPRFWTGRPTCWASETANVSSQTWGSQP